MVRLTVKTDESAVLTASASESVRLNAEPHIVVDRTTVYDGAYEWTPSDTVQTIEIQDKKALNNITINPVPQNYGLITWDGTTLTVS